MISRKRSKLDIISDALKYTIDGTTKTNLILGLGLGWRNGEKILDLLVSRNLIQEINSYPRQSVTRYRLTREGMHFLEVYDKIKQTIGYEIINNYQLT